jgi:hypothetical protein
MTPPSIHALAHLRDTENHLSSARGCALLAEPHLTGARATRCAELTEKIADAIAYAHRLAFVAASDISTELHQQGLGK